ncbi:P-type conjugative transfer protein TrbJ [Mesorhizobium sp. M7A.F.Ca.AU.002.06.1.1]|nr:P-type conjugative transfer protein TrbJ [Mesorhizobium sp. Primo-B]RUU34008.1 P-type conjugative transfer protein TrbJ [Mesorhizobium sp. Primo-A]RVB81199.1 P-type conjugative transfer protein TrbJ [Mesorhizobium sp. M7A.F.Ca.AU.002.03.1.1]RVB95037.1 P-type conjugative transfer protein TrbJ [Mesorhizobium sp. M7A.F.Ca.AU.002.04.1.1]RVC04024.1 P-type conjugative transfer protein TrbJ [Mesorhizobium sp. M7A.F.Ca.AU.002.06.1.1]RVC09913.1 P-type conjugative transfer protein TrbJ [Mesorhizobium
MSIPARCRIRRMAAAGALVAAVALSSVPAFAFIVFDPRNYAENLLSASRALEQIQNQVTSLQNEAQMLINQAKNLTSLPTSMLDQIEGNFSQMKSLLGEANKLAYNVQDIDSQFTSAYENFGTDLSSQQLVDGARERWRTSVSAFEHSLKAGAVAVDNIDGTQQQTSALVDASQSAVGVLQATQAGNQLLAVQARQVADLTAMLAAQGRAAALEQARTAAAQEQAREQFSRFMTGSRYTASSVKMFHD